MSKFMRISADADPDAELRYTSSQNRSNYLIKSSIYFDIGFKLNGKFFSTYDSL